MKKLALLLFAITFLQLTYAQEAVSPNSFFLGGSLNFTTQNDISSFSSLPISPFPFPLINNENRSTQTTSFSVAPYFGKALNKNWQAGISVYFGVYNYELSTTTNSLDQNSKDIGFGLFARYIVNPEHALKFYLQPYVSYNFADSEVEERNSLNLRTMTNLEERYFQAGSRFGILYQLSQRWRATLNIGNINYLNGSVESGTALTTRNYDSINTNFSLSALRLGFELKI